MSIFLCPADGVRQLCSSPAASQPHPPPGLWNRCFPANMRFHQRGPQSRGESQCNTCKYSDKQISDTHKGAPTNTHKHKTWLPLKNNLRNKKPVIQLTVLCNHDSMLDEPNLREVVLDDGIQCLVLPRINWRCIGCALESNAQCFHTQGLYSATRPPWKDVLLNQILFCLDWKTGPQAVTIFWCASFI